MNFKQIEEIEKVQKKSHDFSCGYPVFPWKKNIVIYGFVISELLRHNPLIYETYNIYVILGYMYMKQREYGINEIPHSLIHNYVSICDIFIYQHCYDNHEILSSSNLLSLTKQGCKCIRLTNPQNSALWALHFSKENRTVVNIHDEYIKTMRIFKQTDELSDTPVYNYVVENIKYKKLFIDRPHPTLLLFYQIYIHLCNILKIEYVFYTEEFLINNPNPCQLPGFLPHCSLDLKIHNLCYISPEELNIGDLSLLKEE